MKLKSIDGGSWAEDIMRRLIQSLPNLEVLAIDTSSTVDAEETETHLGTYSRILERKPFQAH